MKEVLPPAVSSPEVVTTRLETLRDYIRWSVTQFNKHGLFFGHGVEDAWDEARYLILGALRMPFDLPDEYLSCRLEQDEKQYLYRLTQARIYERIPVAYLLGEAWFCNLNFIVDERVLIPRSPIAELIENRFSPWLVNEPGSILDLCCGSGCIGIACAYAFRDAQVTLGDISFAALEVANLNIERHDLEDRVYAVQSDLFEGLPKQAFDLIVSNPPYVDRSDLESMPEEYHHEPVLALEAGSDGLDLVRHILAQAADHLNDDGLLVVEVGNSRVHLEERYPEVDFVWPKLERGGHGVFLLTADQCRRYRALFQSRCEVADANMLLN